MKESMVADEVELYQPVVDAIEAAASWRQQLPGPETKDHRDQQVDTLRVGLRRSAMSRGAIRLLEVLPTSYTVDLVDEVVRKALSVRDTERMRNLLGRLSYREAREVVPPAVWRLLEREAEAGDGPVYDAWRRMAELLDHLGLFDALRALCAQAADSIDPDVREVAEDFNPGTG